MTRIVTVQTTGSLKDTFLTARAACDPALTKAFNRSLTSAKRVAVATAPVYDPIRWVGTRYAHLPHHLGPHGWLKASIGRVPFGVHANGKLFVGELHAIAGYANWVEKGVLHHNFTGRPVKGRQFMKMGMEFGFERTFDKNLHVALIETFGGKP